MSLIGYIYVKNGYFMPKLWNRINDIASTLLCLAPVICGIVLKDFLAYIGFSISVWTLAFFTMIYAVSNIYSDIKHSNTKPIFFSPWIFPVYVFDPKRNDVKLHNTPAIALIMSLMILICWSATCTVWVTPSYIGVALGIAFELMLLVSFLFMISVT